MSKHSYRSHPSPRKQRGFITTSTSNGRKHSARIVAEANNSINATLLHTQSSLDGLVEADAEERLHQNGPNEVAHDKPPHVVVQLLLAFKNPFVIVLLVLAGISYLTDVYFAARTIATGPASASCSPW